MSPIWIRINGQAELRTNVRTALKGARLSQRAGAEKAGVKYNSLISFLAANTWLRYDDAKALAKALEIPFKDLVGRSIFKEEREQYAQFDHMPPDVASRSAERKANAAEAQKERAAELAAGRTRALCCVCGAVRTCNGNKRRRETSSDYWRPRDGHRVTEDLKCFECREITTHAVLLLAEERDNPEQLDRRPSHYAIAVRERDAFIDRLREFNVIVTSRRGYTSKDTGSFYSSGYRFNKNVMQWMIELDENMPPRLQVVMLQEFWTAISTDEHGEGVDWDPRDGVWWTPGKKRWSTVTDDLMKDIDRFLHIERARMVLDLREELHATEDSRQADGQTAEQADQ